MPQDLSLGFRFQKPTPVVAVTLVILLGVWVLCAIGVRFVPGGKYLYDALAFDPDLALRGQNLWGLVTGPLLHNLADVDHLVFNGLVFSFFACDLEQRWGRRRFILFTLLCALSGNAFVMAAALLDVSHANVVGFSGVVLGAVTAWGISYPTREVFFIFFRLRGLHLVYVSFAMQVLTALSFSSVSAAAHFGGMATGAAFAMVHSGLLRRTWLRRKLARLEAEAATLEESSRRRRLN